MSGRTKRVSERSDDGDDYSEGRDAKRHASEAEMNMTQDEEPDPTLQQRLEKDFPLEQRRRRATSSESVSIYNPPSQSPEPEAGGRIESLGSRDAANAPIDETRTSQRHRTGNAATEGEEYGAAPDLDASAARNVRDDSPTHRNLQQAHGNRDGAPMAKMVGRSSRMASHDSTQSLFVPQDERSASAGLADDVPITNDTVSAGNWSKFKDIFKELSAQERVTSRLMQQMSTEHNNALERARKVAGRRNFRIEQLERENAALKTKLRSSAVGASSAIQWEEKYNMSEQALQMVTDDCELKETECKKLQSELDSKILENSSAERNLKVAQGQLDSVKKELDACKSELKEAKKAIKGGTAQLGGLQSILERTDDEVIDRVRELSKSNVGTLLDAGGNERLRGKIGGKVKELVEAWKKFEAEYDKALGHTE